MLKAPARVKSGLVAMSFLIYSNPPSIAKISLKHYLSKNIKDGSIDPLVGLLVKSALEEPGNLEEDSESLKLVSLAVNCVILKLGYSSPYYC